MLIPALRSVLSYILSPRTCHRFVGYLEEEAVVTYTHAIEELERGHLPKWYGHFGHALRLGPRSLPA